MDYIGIAVSKKSLDMAFPAGKGYGVKKYANDPLGYEQLLAQLPVSSCVVLEATGPSYVRLATYLHEKQIA